MAGQAGRLGRLLISDDAGATFTLIGCLLDASLDGSGDTLDTTCHEDGQNKTKIAGKREHSIDANYNYVEDDAGQVILKNTWFGTMDGIKARWQFEQTVGKLEYTADVIITSWGPGIPNDDVSTVDVTLEVSGEVIESTQA